MSPIEVPKEDLKEDLKEVPKEDPKEDPNEVAIEDPNEVAIEDPEEIAKEDPSAGNDPSSRTPLSSPGTREDRGAGHSSSSDSEELVRFGLSMPAPLVRDLDEWRKDRGYANRSEAIRDLVRDALIEKHWQDSEPTTEMVGVVTIVYDHTTRQLSDHLTDMQHHAHHISQATLHIHLNPDNCLEVIVLRGPRSEVMALANHLISTKGVLHGKFIPTTTGEDLT